MLRVGIIGTGIVAHEHARAISMLRGAVRLVAAADTAPRSLEAFGTAWNVARMYASASELIADPDVDLVAVATPPAAHEECVVAALTAGKRVLCEKPLAHSLASAVRIAEAEARHPGNLATSYQLRYEPLFRRMTWLCQNGWIGEIESAVVERHGSIPHPGAGNSGWWGAWAISGGGVLMTQMIHELDLLLQVMGRPVSVNADMDTRHTSIESEDWIEASIRFANGGTARCVASVNSGRLAGRMTIAGTLGSISIPGTLTTSDPARLRQALEAVDAALPDTRLPSASLPARVARKVASRLGRGARDLTPHARLYRDIARKAGAGAPLPIPSAEAMKSLQLCAAVYESALTATEIHLPLDSRSIVFAGVSKSRYDARPSSHRPVPRRPSSGRTATTVRIGMIGLDTSHVPAFANLLHNPFEPFHIPGARVVAAFPGGSPDMPVSISRVGGFTAELRDKHGVAILDSPERVADACDLVFIHASDGRTHPDLVRGVAGRGRAVFVDKPFAVSASHAGEIFRIAEATGTRVFGSSAFRYADGLVSALRSIRESGERVETCRIRCWLPIQETQGRYFWYGIHAAEMLVAIMGAGVSEVEASGDADRDTITVRHRDGRESQIDGSRHDGTFEVRLQTDRRQLVVNLASSMPALSARILWAALDVLTDGSFPRVWSASSAGSVSGPRRGREFDPVPAETMEVVRVLDAAQRSHASREKIPVEHLVLQGSGRRQ